MGQYYYPTNCDKMEYLYSHNFDNGLKILEHSYLGNVFVKAVEMLLSPNGSWYKSRLVWAGDYMDEGLFMPPKAPKSQIVDGQEYKYNLHTYVRECGKNAVTNSEILDDIEDYGKRIKKAKSIGTKWFKTLPKNGRYLVNHTKRVCLDLTAEKGNGEKWGNGKDIIIHPMPILTASGNGRGGGDYEGSNMALVGSWAGDVISMEYEPMFTLNKPISFIEGAESQGDYSFVTIEKEVVTA